MTIRNKEGDYMKISIKLKRGKLQILEEKIRGFVLE